MRLVAVLALLGSTFAVACAATPAPEPFQSEDSSAATKPSKKTRSGSEADDSATAPASTASVPDRAPPTEGDAPIEPAPPVQASDTTWTGTLTKTTATNFGGAPYCDYRTHLENVTVKLVIGADGKIKSADVQARAVEEGLNNCPNPALAPNLHDYALTAEAEGTSFVVDGGGSAAKPHAKMNADVTAAGTTGTVALTWHRNDIDAPFDWTITASVPIKKQ